jgi:hypothetical protein
MAAGRSAMSRSRSSDACCYTIAARAGGHTSSRRGPCRIVAQVPIFRYGVSHRHEFVVCSAVAIRKLRRVDDVVTGSR